MINILTLLSIALSLLNNKQIQSNPALLAQAQSFAAQAVGLAEQSLAAPTSTPLVVNSTPIVINQPIVVHNPTTTLPTDPVLGSAPVVSKLVAPNPPFGLALSASSNGTSTTFLAYFQDGTGQKSSDYLTVATMTVNGITYQMDINKWEATLNLDNTILQSGENDYSSYVETVNYQDSNSASFDL